MAHLYLDPHITFWVQVIFAVLLPHQQIMTTPPSLFLFWLSFITCLLPFDPLCLSWCNVKISPKTVSRYDLWIIILQQKSYFFLQLWPAPLCARNLMWFSMTLQCLWCDCDLATCDQTFPRCHILWSCSEDLSGQRNGLSPDFHGCMSCSMLGHFVYHRFVSAS